MLFLLALVSGLLVLTSACQAAQAGNVSIIVHPTAVHLQNSRGPQDVFATCPAGEVLLGGGYTIEAPTGLFDAMVGVEGTYPGSVTNPVTWQVTFTNFTNETPLVTVDAYCLLSPTPVKVTVAASNSTILGYDLYSISTLTIACPKGSTLLSGGFQVDDLPGAQVENAGVLASEPDLDASGQAAGWKLKLYTYSPGHNLQPTIFALCATNLLLPAPAIHTTPAAFPVGGVERTDQTQPCGASQLTAGGGFEFQGGGGIPNLGNYPKNVYVSIAIGGSSSWQVHAESVYLLDIQVWATCFSVPIS